MKTLKQIFKDLSSWWEESLKDKTFRKTLTWLIVGVVALAIFLAFAFPSSAAEVYSTHEGGTSDTPPYPTDLTGYTVTVPSGFSATAGYGRYSLEGTVNYNNFPFDLGNFEGFSFGVGYDIHEADALWFSSPDICCTFVYHYDDNGILQTTQAFHFDPTQSIVINITGGDTDNTSLIQWFVDNDASFTLSEPVEPEEPDEPNPLVTFPKGVYRINALWYNTTITTQLDGMVFFDLAEGDAYSAITVQNNELLFDRISDQSLQRIAIHSTTGTTWLQNSGQYIYFTQDQLIPQSLAEQIPSLLEYIPGLTLDDFRFMQDSWYYGLQDGFVEWGDDYDRGFEDGFNEGVDNSGSNFFGNFINGILNSLDNLVILPGGISMLDIIKAVGGIFALVWLLKLLAGG